jgi:hypothetical protein
LPLYWRTALGRRDRDRTCRMGAVSQSGPQKAWRNLPLFGTALYLALLWLALYNTALQKIFPLRKHVIWNFVLPCFGCVHIFFFRLWNKVTGPVYFLRARDRFASAARWSSIVLPYLGPEIIALMQTAFTFTPNDLRSGPRRTFCKGDERIIPPMVLSSTLRYSNSRTVGVLNVWVHWRP